MLVDRDDVCSLFERGYVVLSGYDHTLSHRAQSHFLSLVSRLGPELTYLCFEHEQRPDGKREPDDGFIDWTKGSEGFKKDSKYVFHYRPDLGEKIDRTGLVPHHRDEIEELLRVCGELYTYHVRAALSVLVAFDALKIVPVSFANALTNGLSNPAPSSRSVMRLLCYPGAQTPERAKVHYDRSLLTLHAGDRGGSLFAVGKDGAEEFISPKEGELLVFWGCKARRLVRQYGVEINPLAHGSKGNPGEGREAVVSFWHNNDVLWDADPV